MLWLQKHQPKSKSQPMNKSSSRAKPKGVAMDACRAGWPSPPEKTLGPSFWTKVGQKLDLKFCFFQKLFFCQTKMGQTSDTKLNLFQSQNFKPETNKITWSICQPKKTPKSLVSVVFLVPRCWTWSWTPQCPRRSWLRCESCPEASQKISFWEKMVNNVNNGCFWANVGPFLVQFFKFRFVMSQLSGFEDLQGCDPFAAACPKSTARYSEAAEFAPLRSF